MSDQDKTEDRLIAQLKDMCLKMAEFDAVQKSLNEEASLYREIINKASEAIFIIQDGRIKFVNQTATELTGYSKEEGLASQAIETFVHPDDRAMVNQYHIRRQQGDNAPFLYDFRFVSKDGTVKWVEMSSALIMWEGRPAGLCLATDITKRKRADDALRSSEERFRTLFETANDAIFLSDGPKFIECNAKALQIFGCKEKIDIVGHSPMDFSPEKQPDGLNSAESAVKYLNAVLNSGPQIFYWKHCRKDGSLFDAEVSINALTLNGDAYFLGIVRDITERKQVEMALRESEQRLGLALEGGALGLWDWDLKTGVGVWGDRTTRMMGYEPNELDPHIRTWKREVHPDDWEKVSEVLNGHISGRLPFYEAEYRMRSKCGEWKWIHARGKVVEYDKEGNPQRMTGTMRDVTERKKAEEELRKSEEKYRRLIENAYDIVYTTDPGGCLTFANPACVQHIRYSQEELIGRHYLEFIPEEYRKDISRFYGRQFVKKIPDTYYEFPFVTKNGETRWYGQKTQLLMEKGIIVGFQSIARDITDRKRLGEEKLETERKLLHVQKLESLATMAGGIAHDFNNQLAVVLGNLELALMDLAPDSRVKPNIQNAIKAAKQSAELSHQIQTYTGATYYNPVDLDLNKLLNTNPIPLKLRTSKHLTLNLESHNTLPLIKGDPDQIQCLITNILVNASEATEDKVGEIRLSTGVIDCDETYLSRSCLKETPNPGRFVFLEVTDTGCGMDAETQRRLFDPFFSTKFWGRGLGMAKVLGITKGHHGAIILESEVGKGTTIRVLFPASREAQIESVQAIGVVEPQPAVPVSPTRRKTVLVVDDEAGVRDLAVTRLDLLGYDTIVAGDGEEGVNVFRERLNEIDLVMLDFKMPKMNGVEAFWELIRIKPDAKVILCSGYTEEAVMQSFPEQHPAGVLHKPYNMEDLKGELVRLLGTGD